MTEWLMKWSQPQDGTVDVECGRYRLSPVLYGELQDGKVVTVVRWEPLFLLEAEKKHASTGLTT